MIAPTTATIELLWWEGCPSTARAATIVRDAMGAEGLDPGALELREVASDADAEHEGFVGSPTIRIDGRDVAPVEGEPVGLSCRIYHLRDGRVSPTPDPADVREAIRRASR